MTTLPLAVLAALAIGLSLGLLGGGGSVLTVPVFVYMLGLPAKQAIAMSMPVVGCTSLIGALGHWRAGHVAWRTALAFGATTMLGAFAGARASVWLTGTQQLLLLGAAMAAAALSMLRRTPLSATAVAPAPAAQGTLAAVGLAVGVLTGLVGIGGGFLVVPALVLLARVPMAQAIGTSLVVITLNAVMGTAGHLGHAAFDWETIGWFTACAITGSVAGTRLARRVPPATLRRGFAWFLLAVAVLLAWLNRAALGG
jgi:uncharacterized membrane protein YfcA